MTTTTKELNMEVTNKEIIEVTKANINEVIESLDKEDRNYILLNNIRVFNPITGNIGKRFRHYIEKVRVCTHEHTVRNSYERRSGDSYFTLCTTCGYTQLD